MVRFNNRTAVAVITLALASTAHAQLVTPVTQIVNGSFEVPSLGMSKYAYPNATTGSWTYSAGAALVDAQGSSDFYGATAPAGARGKQFAALQKTSSIGQVFHAYAAQSVEVTWLSAGRPTSPDGLAGGNQIYTLKAINTATNVAATETGASMFMTKTGTAFTSNKVFFALTAGANYDLIFQGLATTDQTAFIDNVELVAPPVKPAFHQAFSFAADFGLAGGAVPEPATWGMMLVGFAMLGIVARRRSVALGA